VNSVRQVASALGVALLVTLLSGSGSLPGRFQQAWWVTVGLALLAGAVGLGLHGTVPATPLPAPAGGDPAVDHPPAGREDARSAVMGG
jgi:hypothetical protein